MNTTARILILAMSIILIPHICKAQKIQGKYQICNYSGKLIPLSTVKVLANDTCGKIIYTAPEGNILEIESYTFAMAPKNGGTAYFEMVKGDLLTPTIKEKLALAMPDDVIVIANLNYSNTDGTQGLLDGFNCTVIP